MDHIPATGDNVIEVPYLGGRWVDGDFISFPERWNLQPPPFSIRPTAQSSFATSCIHETLQLLQRWLFFGLFTETFRLNGVTFDRFVFLEITETAVDLYARVEPTGGQPLYRVFSNLDSNGNRYRISTKNLPEYFQRFAAEEQRKPTSNEKTSRLRKIVSYLWRANEALKEYIPHLHVNRDRPLHHVSGPIVVSIYSCLNALLEHCKIVYSPVPEVHILSSTYIHIPWYLKGRMEQEGWCPNTVSRLFSQGGINLQYLAYTHGRFGLTSGNHSSCTWLSCDRANVDEATYEVKHSQYGTCACHFEEAPQDIVALILRNGGIPVCRLIGYHSDARGAEWVKEGKGVRIEVKAAAPDAEYATISHVWSHGLGNPNKNSLPVCQLVRLQAAVNALCFQRDLKTPEKLPYFFEDNEWWWMDTLCVPVHPDAKALRKLAIIRMRETYENAKSTLVVDRDLMSLRSVLKNGSLAECIILGMRIILSTWFSRMWTMQESLLSKDVRVLLGQYGEGFTSFDLDQLFKPLKNVLHRQSALGNDLVDSLLWTFRALRGSVDPDRDLSAVLTAVGHRATTRRSDEPFCLASLCNLNVQAILDVEVTEEGPSKDETLAQHRMTRLYSLLGSVPNSLIFSTGPRLLEQGFGWAPRSFLTFNNSQTKWERNRDATVTTKGLEVSLPATFLSEDLPDLKGFKIEGVFAVDNKPVPLIAVVIPDQDQVEDHRPSCLGNGLLLLHQHAITDSTGVRSLLVDILTSDLTEEIVEVKYLHVMQVVPMEIERVITGPPVPIVEGVTLESRKWCVR